MRPFTVITIEDWHSILGIWKALREIEPFIKPGKKSVIEINGIKTVLTSRRDWILYRYSSEFG